MSMKQILSIVVVGLLFAFTMSCESESANARLEVYLTDAPGDYENVFVDIQSVAVHGSEEDGGSGWNELAVVPGKYDLLELTNGLDTLLGSIELPPGKISQIRLKLGSDNTIVVGGETHALKTPSGMQSGIKILVNAVLTEGITYKVLLDFDVARSVVEKGNGTYSLKPVIRAITNPMDGAISGVIDPPAATPAIYAIAGIDTVGSAYTDDAGRFLLRGLAPGAYTVSVSPNEEYTPKTFENVQVTVGSITDLGTVSLAD
jgi:hypothetical protein